MSSPTSTLRTIPFARGTQPIPASRPAIFDGDRLPIGPYDAIAFLAEGGMGSVYLAEERATGKRVALKVLDPRLASSEEVVDRFLSERDVSARTEHHGLVRVLDGGRDSDRAPYLAMELLDGECLASLLERGRIEVGAVAAIGAQIADAMAAMHGARIIHRDLKPDNVFVLYGAGLAGWPQIKVLDFGVARFLDDAGFEDELVCGTPAYMAAEQWHGHSDERSDIYALGCLLYELLTGQPPFAGTLAELMASHCDALPEPIRIHRPSVPRELETAVLRMLAKDARMRPRSMRDIARELGDLAYAMPPGARADIVVDDLVATG